MLKNVSIALWTVSLLFVSATLAPAANVFNIDLGNNASSGGFPGGAAAWNTITVPSEITGANYPSMSDSTGSFLAGVTLHGTGTITDNPNSPANIFNNPTGGPSWVTTDGSLANTQAAQDAFYTTNSSTSSFTLELTNLPGDLVTVDLFSSRLSGSADGFFEYSTDNSTWFGFNVLEKDGTPTSAAYWLGTDTASTVYRGQDDGNSNARYMSASLALPSGSLFLRARDNSSGQFAVLNAFRLQVSTTPPVAIPEPSSLLLLGLGGLGLIRQARRRRKTVS